MLLLLLLQELQRLNVKCEEALSESAGLREECGLLAATVETLRAAAAATTSDDGEMSGKPTDAAEADMGNESEEKDKGEGDFSPSVEEAQEEILRLRKTIEDLERTAEEINVARGRAKRDDQEEQGDEMGEVRRQVSEERDSLRAELGEEKQKAAARVAGLEMQLADKEVRILPDHPTYASTLPSQLIRVEG